MENVIYAQFGKKQVKEAYQQEDTELLERIEKIKASIVRLNALFDLQEGGKNGCKID